LKICYLAHAHSVHTMKWIQYFIEKGHDVSLISFNDPLWQVRGLKFYKLKKLISTRIDFLLNVGRVKRLLKQISPDILHAHYATDYGFLGALTGFHPFILSVWGSDIYITPRRSFLHKMAVEFNLGNADEICSTSRAMAEETRKYLKNKVNINITPFGVDTDIFRPMKKSINVNEIVIGAVKALEKNKGYGTDLLIEVFAELAAKHDGLKLKIVGDGNHRCELEELAASLGIADKVEFLGQIKHSEMPQFMSDLDIFCCLSRSGNESFGVSPAEASSCGVPVISSRAGGLPEVIKDLETGLLVETNNKGQIMDAFKILIQRPGLRALLGANGRKFVQQNYEWRDNAAIMDNIYEGIIGGRGLK